MNNYEKGKFEYWKAEAEEARREAKKLRAELNSYTKRSAELKARKAALQEVIALVKNMISGNGEWRESE